MLHLGYSCTDVYRRHMRWRAAGWLARCQLGAQQLWIVLSLSYYFQLFATTSTVAYFADLSLIDIYCRANLFEFSLAVPKLEAFYKGTTYIAIGMASWLLSWNVIKGFQWKLNNPTTVLVPICGRRAASCLIECLYRGLSQMMIYRCALCNFINARPSWKQSEIIEIYHFNSIFIRVSN